MFTQFFLTFSEKESPIENKCVNEKQDLIYNDSILIVIAFILKNLYYLKCYFKTNLMFAKHAYNKRNILFANNVNYVIN